MLPPVFDGYFADPFILSPSAGGYVAYGTREMAGRVDGRVFESLFSADLVHWESRGPVLNRLDDACGDEYWAPEVVEAEGAFWMYFSVGHGIAGHHIRVARSLSQFGPFQDCGVSLTPQELFAIDPHPFRDTGGNWYLAFARDVLDSPRPGTHLAIAPLLSMTGLAHPPTSILAPDADWQLYERGRSMYGAQYDWHTLEGPFVVHRHGRYWLTYSGGAWTGDSYAVSWAVAENPLGPWSHAPVGALPLLATRPGELLGPGHSSITSDPSGRDVIAFHSWDDDLLARRMHLRYISFDPDGPRLGGPVDGR